MSDEAPWVDVPWIREQMQREAGSMEEAPRCWVCGDYGPGLFWLPSEVGVIEMPVWLCSLHTTNWGGAEHYERRKTGT